MVTLGGWVWLSFGTLIWILSFVLFLIINSFVINRSLAMQSSLDWLMRHTMISRMIFTTLSLLMEIIIIIFPLGQLNQYFCLVIYSLYCTNLSIYNASKTINLINRYILIFKSFWFENLTDDEIVKLARWVKIILTSIYIGLDLIGNEREYS